MKVILLKDIPGVGQKGDVKNVADGYAVNFLIPQQKAEPADETKIAALEKKQVEAEKSRERDAARAAEAAKHLEGAYVTLRVQANDEGHLYSQVLPGAIAARIKAEQGVDVSEDAILIAAPIKSLGRAVIQVKLGTRRVPVTVSVERSN